MMRPISPVVRLAAAAALVAALGGCSTVKGWFSGKDKEGEKPVEPAELVDVTPTVTVAKLWSANVGKGEKRLGLQQAPVVDGGRVYAAAVEGALEQLKLRGQAFRLTARCTGTRYIDVVTFTPKVLPKATGLFLERWFRNRHHTAAKGLEVDPQVTGVSVLRVLVEEEPK